MSDSVQVWGSAVYNATRRLLGTAIRGTLRSTAMLLAPILRRFRREGEQLVLVIPPAHPGSLGDTAMLEGLVQEIDRDVVLVRFSANSRWSVVGAEDNGPVVDGPLLWIRILPWLMRCSSMYVIGADSLDGIYSETKPRLVMEVSSLAVRCGVATNIVCFSLNREPTPTAIRAWKVLDERVRLVTRDPRSAERVQALLGRWTETAPDLAFRTFGPSLDPPFGNSTRRIAICPNANPRFVSAIGSLDDYVFGWAEMLRLFLAEHSDYEVLAIPHDWRGSPNDYDLCLRIRDSIGEKVLPVPVRRPAEVRAHLKACELTISARMHAAIAALTESVPPLILGYQDKAEGMMGYFELEGLVLQPDILQTPDEMTRVVESALADRTRYRNLIQSRLDEVVTAAAGHVAKPH